MSGRLDPFEREARRSGSATHLERQAQVDAIRDQSRAIPDPAVFARYLPLSLAEPLLGARWVLTDRAWYVTQEQATRLRPYGLAGYGEPCLTAFGIAVRKALREQDA